MVSNGEGLVMVKNKGIIMTSFNIFVYRDDNYKTIHFAKSRGGYR